MMIKDWLADYHPANAQETREALREIMQIIALAGLYRAGFFEKAAFYGGTALRIFHGIDRFSEDLDFSLLMPDPEFMLNKYQDTLIEEFESLGMKVSVLEKKKSKESNIDSAFLKSETIWKELILEGMIPQNGIHQVANLKIKIEVDREPPVGFQTEDKLLLRPFSFYVRCFTLANLFAGKMHALLFRKWGTNVKGRDWYDLEWYVRKGVPLNLVHFVRRAKDSGDWAGESITETQLKELLHQKIDAVNMQYVKDDISRFIRNSNVLEIWTPSYFHDLADKLRFEIR